MKTKKKFIIIVSVCLLLVVCICISINPIKSFLLDRNLIHISEKEVISFFEKNKDDLKIAADYVISQSSFYEENTDTQESNKEFKLGEMTEYISIYHGKEGHYRCDVYNKITADKESNLLKRIEPYNLNPDIEPSFNKLTTGYVRSVATKETNNKSVYVNFLLKGYAVYDQQHIIYFKDKEHDLNFMFGFKVVPLSEEGWYYLALGDAENW